MLVAAERNNPGLWTKIDTLADLDKDVVKPFWDLHENKEDRMLNFRYRLCRLMEYFLDKRLVKSNVTRLLLAVTGYPTIGCIQKSYVKIFGFHRKSSVPTMRGGPIPTASAREDAHSVAKV
jgi:hypothetical protein